MAEYKKGLSVLSELFGRDYTFVLATAKENIPSTRVIDTYYTDGVFWVVTYATSNKVQELERNPHVSLCNNFHSFKGIVTNEGHPLKEENKAIREKLIQVFEKWYFAHNNEGDEHMCYVKIIPESGFFHKDGTAYRMDFLTQEVKSFPFAPDIEMIE